MKHLPQSQLTGNLHKSSVKEFTTNKGSTGVNFTFVEQYVYKNKEGELVKGKPYYHDRCVAYGLDAEIIKAAAKEEGIKLSFVKESIQEEYTDKEGVKRYPTKVVARFVKAYRWNKETREWDLQELVDAKQSAAAEGGSDLPF